MENPPRGLVERASSVLRRKHYSLRTERSYLLWLERFLAFHRHRNPKGFGPPFEAPVSAARARTTRRIPTVLSRDETRLVLGYLAGEYQLMAQLLYGSGLRLTPALAPERSAGASVECLRLRVKDLDFDNHQG